jgi:hypothetical protein
MTGPGPMPFAPLPVIDNMRVGLWGPPSSGKTTFLASLNIATNRWRGPGHWIMNGADDNSSDFLTRSTDLLTRQNLFPSFTTASENLLFRFTGNEGQELGNGRRPAAPPSRVAFELDVLDVPGERFNAERSADRQESDRQEVTLDDEDDGRVVDTRADADEELLRHLEICGGLVYLFDPVRDAQYGDAYQFFHRIIEKLSRRVFDQVRYSGDHLPHYLALCVTKFDAPEVYENARRWGLTTYSEYPPGLPYVPDTYAYEFFRQLCMTGHGTADLVHQALPKYFHPDRIGIFVTSAVGFYVGPGQRFRPNDYANVYRDNGKDRIKGGVYPINVLEPVVWLQNRLRYAR